MMIMNVRRFYDRKKFTAAQAGKDDVKVTTTFINIDDRVLIKFSVGFTSLGARVFRLLWLSTRSTDT